MTAMRAWIELRDDGRLCCCRCGATSRSVDGRELEDIRRLARRFDAEHAGCAARVGVATWA